MATEPGSHLRLQRRRWLGGKLANRCDGMLYTPEGSTREDVQP